MLVDVVWVWYLVTVSVTVAVFGWGNGPGQPVLFLAIHGGLLVTLGALRHWVAHRDAFPRRAARAGYTLVALPVVFSALGLVLPAIHPQPWEWCWVAWDHALFGRDPTRALEPMLAPWSTEILQWVYASFYFIPVATVLVIGWRRGGNAFDRALLTVAFCFLLSYLSYLLWPTLPPYRFLPHESPLEGVWMGGALRDLLDTAELNRWDCFPSGHAMLSVVCVVLAWRQVRPLAWALMPLVAALLLSTMALRYHYFADVLAALLSVWPAMWFVDRCLVEGTPG